MSMLYKLRNIFHEIFGEIFIIEIHENVHLYTSSYKIVRKYAFANRITDLWNSLPDACLNSTTLNQFKSHISKLLAPEVRTQSCYPR